MGEQPAPYESRESGKNLGDGGRNFDPAVFLLEGSIGEAAS